MSTYPNTDARREYMRKYMKARRKAARVKSALVMDWYAKDAADDSVWAVEEAKRVITGSIR